MPEDCSAPGASHRSWFSVKVCPTMLSYDKEVVKTSNISALYPNLLFNICLHFFSWNLYSYMKTLMSLPWGLLRITSEDYVRSLLYDLFLSSITVWNEKNNVSCLLTGKLLSIQNALQ